MDIPTSEEAAGIEVRDLPLYEALRSTRRKIAARLNIPSHLLVPDRVLRTMANTPPRSREDCLAIDGMGPITFQKCGRELLNAIEDHLHEQKVTAAMKGDIAALKDLSPALRATWDCAVKGLSLAEIAAHRNLTDGTASNHLAELLLRGIQLPIDTIVPTSHQQEIRGAVLNLRDKNLKRIKAVVDSAITYAEIRVVLALIEREKHS